MGASARRATLVALCLSMTLITWSVARGAAPAAAAFVTSPDGLWSWVRPLPFGYPAGPGFIYSAPGSVGKWSGTLRLVRPDG
jgi:hypothetical protein